MNQLCLRPPCRQIPCTAAQLCVVLVWLVLAWPAPVPAAEARPTLRIALPSDITSLNPLAAPDQITLSLLFLCFDTLARVTPDGDLRPNLAEAWEPIEDGRRWRFRLRSDVRFHSGRPLTAEDVRRSIEWLMKPGRTMPMMGIYLRRLSGLSAFSGGTSDHLTGLRVIDANQFEVDFDGPEVLFPAYPIPIVDFEALESGQSAGTGPFRLESWQHGQSITLSANDHWRQGHPQAARLTFLVLPRFETAFQLFAAGELDYLPVAGDGLARVAADRRHRDQLVVSPRVQVRQFGMNPALYPAFADLRVRRAISLAIDRESVVTGIFRGYATSPRGLLPPGVAGYDDLHLPELRFDPGQARRLLAEAGYPEGRGLPPIELAATQGYQTEMTYYADQLRQVLGLPVTGRIYERGTFVSAANDGKFAFLLNGWTADYLDARTFLEPMWSSDSPANRARWRDPEFDALLADAGRTADPARRIDLYHQAERHLIDEAAAAPLPVPLRVVLRQPTARMLAPEPMTDFAYHPIQD